MKENDAYDTEDYGNTWQINIHQIKVTGSNFSLAGSCNTLIML